MFTTTPPPCGWRGSMASRVPRITAPRLTPTWRHEQMRVGGRPQRFTTDDAGVVAENVESSEVFGCGPEHLGQILEAAHIDPHELGGPSLVVIFDTVSSAALVIDIRHQHGGTPLSHMPGTASADAGSRTRDNGDLARDVHGRRLNPKPVRKSITALFTSAGRSCCVQCPVAGSITLPRRSGTHSSISAVRRHHRHRVLLAGDEQGGGRPPWYGRGLRSVPNCAACCDTS